MLRLSDLDLPLIVAPMAGGPSTPALVEATARAGGLGFLAAGYLTPQALFAQTARLRESDLPFGVNLFVVPEVPLTPAERAALERYREALEPLAHELGVEVGPAVMDDDFWDAKSYHLFREPVPAVSFTFGLPPREFVRDMDRAGTLTLATVTDVDEARRAAQLGVRALVVQGSEAGGHRATLDTSAEPNDLPVDELLTRVRAEVDLPLVAAGGLSTAADVRRVLGGGAVAAQVGTALLLSDEAGTSPTARAALRDERFTATRATRAYSGRVAQGLRNEFMDRFDDLAPALYPAVNSMTAPLRAAAARAGDAQIAHTWAGTGWRAAQEGPAGDILRALAPARETMDT